MDWNKRVCDIQSNILILLLNPNNLFHSQDLGASLVLETAERFHEEICPILSPRDMRGANDFGVYQFPDKVPSYIDMF